MNTMSRGSNDPVWRSIDPATTNTYNLGSSTNKWGTVYATTFDGNLQGNATSASALTGIDLNKFLIGQGTNSEVIGASNIEYVNQNVAIGNNTAARFGLYIGGQCYGNDVNYITSDTVGEISAGDGGPQILFGDAATFNDSSQRGALIYTNNDTPSTGVSWHFVSNQGDWNVSSKRFTARTSVTIGAGTNKPNTSYNLHVTGTGYFTSALYCNGIAANVDNSSSAGGISLYSTASASAIGNYGIAMRTGSAHGWIVAKEDNANKASALGITNNSSGVDWNINFYNSGSTNRGWKWIHGSVAVASINGNGYAQFNRIGLNRIGGNKYGRLYWNSPTYYTWVDYMSDSTAGSCPTGG